MDQPQRPDTLSGHFENAYKRFAPWRGRSLQLMMVVLLFVILAGGFAQRVDTLHQLFWFVTINILFFAVIIVLALREFRKTMRAYFRERERVYGEVMGDEQFVSHLRDGIDSGRDLEHNHSDLPKLDMRAAAQQDGDA